MSHLKWSVLSLRRPGLSRELPPGKEKLAWVANSSTLISGDRDAILVDTFLSVEHANMLVDWVVANGKNLTKIYITHGHGDHFFGLVPLLERFPNAKAVALPQVVEEMKAQLSPKWIDDFWRKRMPGQIPDRLVVADPLQNNEIEIELEGNKMIIVDTGKTDTTCTTSLYVPSIELLVAGDVVYNETHVYLAETSTESRLQWIAALDKLGDLRPKAVIAGHKVPENDDSPRNIELTKQYLRDFNRLDATTKTPLELYNAMLAIYPNRANPGSLWGASHAAKASQ